MGNHISNYIENNSTIPTLPTEFEDMCENVTDQYAFIPTLTEFEEMKGPHPKLLALAETLGIGFDSENLSFQKVVDRLDNVFFWPGETRDTTMMAWMAMKQDANPNTFAHFGTCLVAEYSS